MQRGACVRVFYKHEDIVSTLTFSPDGRYLATAGTSFIAGGIAFGQKFIGSQQERTSLSAYGIWGQESVSRR